MALRFDKTYCGRRDVALGQGQAPSLDVVKLQASPHTGIVSLPEGEQAPEWHFKVPGRIQAKNVAVVVFNPDQGAIADEECLKRVRDGIKTAMAKWTPIEIHVGLTHSARFNAALGVHGEAPLYLFAGYV